MLKKMKALITDEQGQGMTEYGLVLGIIAIAVIGILVTLKGQIATLFQNVSDSLKSNAGV